MVTTAIAVAIELVAGTCLIIMLHWQCCDVGFVVLYSNLQVRVHSELLLQDRVFSTTEHCKNWVVIYLCMVITNNVDITKSTGDRDQQY